jgi:hypothetical protein
MAVFDTLRAGTKTVVLRHAEPPSSKNRLLAASEACARFRILAPVPLRSSKAVTPARSMRPAGATCLESRPAPRCVALPDRAAVRGHPQSEQVISPARSLAFSTI